MNLAEFTEGMTSLKDHYGEQKYSKTLDKIILDWVQGNRIPAKAWIEVVTKAISTEQHPPRLPKLQEIWFDVRKRYQSSNILNACLYCGGHGLYFDPASGAPGKAYACRCDVGMGMHPSIARWNGELVRANPTAKELEYRNVRTLISESVTKE